MNNYNSRMLTRRTFLQTTAAAGAATLTGAADLCAATYDLVIRGGRVIDPSRRLDSMMDVAVSRGKIAAILPSGTAKDAAEVFDAAGKLVLPGLIDIHAHTRTKEMPALCLADGVTAIVDGGSRGADQIDEIVAIAKGAPNRVRVLLNIARTGILPEGELLDIGQVDVAAARKAIERHRDVIVGVKARISRTVAGTNDLEALRRAQAIVEPFRLRVMVHVGDTVSPMPAILALLKPGDIVTHVYAPPPNGIFDDSGQLLPEVLAARRRGIRFDIGQRADRAHHMGRRRTRYPREVPARHDFVGLERCRSNGPGLRFSQRAVEVSASGHATRRGRCPGHDQCRQRLPGLRGFGNAARGRRCRHRHPRHARGRVRVRRQRQDAANGQVETVRACLRHGWQTGQENGLSRAAVHDATARCAVEAYARLHFGVLDLRGAGGRWFGGIGAAASAPSLLLSALQLTAHRRGRGCGSSGGIRPAVSAHHHIQAVRTSACIARCRPTPGLGSGTQLALAIARALAELYGIDTRPASLARAMGRAQRSAIGTWTFAGGGLVVEGGRRTKSDECGPLMARLPFPESWRCVVVVPDGPPGISGADEADAFARLPKPSERDVEHVSHLVLMSLLPALADGDLEQFGRALTEIQEVTGRWFAPAQGGTFASGPSRALVQQLAEWGAFGVGQSSWGPTVYGIVDGADTAGRACRTREGAHGFTGQVFEGPFRSEGARVWRLPVAYSYCLCRAAIRIPRRGGHMIKVSVMYPNTSGAKFDMAYYLDSHMPMVRDMLAGVLKGMNVEEGLARRTAWSACPVFGVRPSAVRVGRCVSGRVRAA